MIILLCALRRNKIAGIRRTVTASARGISNTLIEHTNTYAPFTRLDDIPMMNLLTRDSGSPPLLRHVFGVGRHIRRQYRTLRLWKLNRE